MATGKRKRTSIDAGLSDQQRPPHLPADSINPFSRSPGQLFQFSVAGLADTDEDPSESIPWFPHRALGRDLLPHGADSDPEQEATSAAETETDDPAKAKHGDKKKTISHRERHQRVLLQAIHHFLDQGQIAKAARSYGLNLHLEVPQGSPVDIRRHNLWSIGAEILMREGEEDNTEEFSTPRRRQRWGSAANMSRVRAYFDELIQRYPYDRQHPRRICALDFWIAMLGLEIYNVHAEHVIALENLGSSRAASRDGSSAALSNDELRSPEQSKDRIRLAALKSMEAIAEKMEKLGQDQPYSKNQQFLELRASVSLYIGDLLLPVAGASSLERAFGEETRLNMHDQARDDLKKIADLGGQLNPIAMAFLGRTYESTEAETPRMHSALPIR